jgi:hypothetical protein
MDTTILNEKETAWTLGSHLMAKHKTITHLPPPAAPPPAAPRLAIQLLVLMGEVAVIGAAVLGFVTATSWLLAGAELRSRSAPAHPPRPTEWVCWLDRRYGEMCEPADRQPPVRRHYARDGY